MRVLDDSGAGVSVGDAVHLTDLGLPVRATQPTLIVFWKRL